MDKMSIVAIFDLSPKTQKILLGESMVKWTKIVLRLTNNIIVLVKGLQIVENVM